MLNRFLSCVFLLSFIHSAQAANNNMRFEHLSEPIRIDWQGGQAAAQTSRLFCLKTDNSAEPSRLESSTISYFLRFQGLSNGSNDILAVSEGNQLPVTLSLATSGRTQSVVANRDTDIIHGDTFCEGPGNNLRLEARVNNLRNYPAGNYQAIVRVSAKTGLYEALSEQTFNIEIRIPEMITLSIPEKVIVLDDFKKPQKEVKFCVNRNGSGSFTLRATTPSSNDGSFEMVRAGQQPDRIKYHLAVRSSTKGLQTITPQALLTGLKGSKSCDSSSLFLNVSVPASEIERAYAGDYQGQLTISVGVQ